MPPANPDSGDKRVARLEFRATSALKADIQRAATLMGMDDTSYALSVLGEHARATIESYHRTQLSQADRAAFASSHWMPADQIRLAALVLDVPDDDGEAATTRRTHFYEALGFQPFPSQPRRMFITAATLRQAKATP